MKTFDIGSFTFKIEPVGLDRGKTSKLTHDGEHVSFCVAGAEPGAARRWLEAKLAVHHEKLGNTLQCAAGLTRNIELLDEALASKPQLRLV